MGLRHVQVLKVSNASIKSRFRISDSDCGQTAFEHREIIQRIAGDSTRAGSISRYSTSLRSDGPLLTPSGRTSKNRLSEISAEPHLLDDIDRRSGSKAPGPGHS
jgi:hypothetical protein